MVFVQQVVVLPPSDRFPNKSWFSPTIVTEEAAVAAEAVMTAKAVVTTSSIVTRPAKVTREIVVTGSCNDSISRGE